MRSTQALRGATEAAFLHAKGRMWTTLWKDVASSHAFERIPPAELVTEPEIAAVPAPARQYLRFYGVVPGKAKHWSLRLRWTGRFRLGRTAPWFPMEAVQYNLRSPITRIFVMRGRMRRVIPMIGRDTYVAGHGRLVAKIADLVTVADGAGREYDDGELVTWLNDAVLFAPSMLLGSHARWSEVDDRSFRIAITDGGRTVGGRVFVDGRGAPENFETMDRFLEDPDDPKRGLVRGCWTTPITGWQTIDGMSFPKGGVATWRLPTGDLPYADFAVDPASLAFDAPPASYAHAA